MENTENTQRSKSTKSISTEEAEDARLIVAEEEAIDDSHDGSRKRDRSRWIRPLILAFMVLFLAMITFSSLSIVITTRFHSYGLATYNSTGNVLLGKEMRGIELHPENHVFRAPKTITHNWVVTSEYRLPDGVKKRVYLVNNEFPGPTIECRSGDKIVVHVTNNLSEDGISIHWHGLKMRNRNSMDGAIGITQCPISVGGKFTYEFEVDEDQAGTFWWHAHSQVQRGDGMYGGLVVHRPGRKNTDAMKYGYKKEVLLLIGDWYHRSAEEILAWYTSTRGFGNEPAPDSLLVNGAGRFVCSMAVPARPLDCMDLQSQDTLAVLRTGLRRASIRLRVVNVGSLSGFTLGADSSSLTPITIDGGFPINTTTVSSVGVLHPGERLDLVLKLDAFRAKSPRLHIALDSENFKYPNPALTPNQSFALFRNTQPSNVENKDVSQTISAGAHLNLSTAISAIETAIPESSQTILLYARTEKLARLSNHPTGFMNRTTWSPQPRPIISLNRTEWDDNQLVPYIPMGPDPIWVDLILNNLDDGSHPFHLHGHDFFVIATSRSEYGWGSYSPFISLEAPVYNLVSPLRKDTVVVPRRGYAVIRFRADNMGLWMLHCHVLFHQGSGMAMALQIGSGEMHELVDMGAAHLCT